MKFNESNVEEADMLPYDSSKQSLDPSPRREPRDPRITKGMVEDHIAALRSINRSLPASPSVISALAKLEDEYAKLFGQRLNELSVPASQHAHSGALELRKQLKSLASDPDPDISHGGIDTIMRRICDSHGCSPRMLHKVFVDCFDKTPDRWVRDHLAAKR